LRRFCHFEICKSFFFSGRQQSGDGSCRKKEEKKKEKITDEDIATLCK